MESTLKYVPLVYEREKNTFIEEYYSGPDVTIKVDGRKFKEISNIQFQVNEQLKPVYGYNSSVYDKVAIGNRIITGSIRVPVNNETSNEYDKILNGDGEFEDNDYDVPGWADNNEDESSSSFFQTDDNTTTDISKLPIITLSKNETNILEFKEDIKKAQIKLVQLGYHVLVNGVLDSLTKNALKAFQEINGLIITGTLTEETKVLLFENGYSTVISDSKLRIGPGDKWDVLCNVNRGTSAIKVFDENAYCFIKILNLNGTTTEGYIESNNLKMVE